jgi:hypothetical protein
MILIIGNILGYIAALSGLVIFISVKRTRILILKIMSDSLFVLHQLCLGMFSGAMLSGIAVARSSVFYHRGQRKWADNPLWLVLFIALTLISPVLTWAGPISLLPTVGSVVCVFSYYVKSTWILRILSFIGEGLWLLYGLLGGSIQLMLFGIVALISLTVGMIREAKQKRTIKKTPALKQMD